MAKLPHSTPGELVEITSASKPRRARHTNGHDPAPDINPSRYESNDIGNARRLVDRFGSDLRYVVNVGWYAWDGKRWAIDAGDVLTKNYAQKTAASIFNEIAGLSDPDARKNRGKWAISSGFSPRINGMLSQAEPHLAVTIDDLDKDPWLLNCENGTVDLRTGGIAAHDRKALITKLSPVQYDYDATCPIWDKFITEIFAKDDGLIEFTHRALGYSLSGITREQVIFIMHGAGSNGKSVLLETVAAIFGDYSRQCPSDTFSTKDKAGGMSNDIARLAGSRLVSVVETDQERRLAEGLVKQATGGDRMAARYLHHEFFEFTPLFKIWLATNHKPRIRGTDHGIWRRIRLLPFAITFGDAETTPDGHPVKDDQLKDKLLLELPGILARLVKGCIDWQESGLRPPKAVEDATSEYREAQDRIAGFLADRCDAAPNYSCRVSSLYDAYKRWCAETGETQIAGNTFGERLDEKGFATMRGTGGTRFRKGLDLKEEYKKAASD